MIFAGNGGEGARVAFEKNQNFASDNTATIRLRTILWKEISNHIEEPKISGTFGPSSGASIKMPPSGVMKLSKKLAIPAKVGDWIPSGVVGDAFFFVDLVALRARGGEPRRRPPTIWAFGFCILVVTVLDGMVGGVVWWVEITGCGVLNE